MVGTAGLTAKMNPTSTAGATLAVWDVKPSQLSQPQVMNQVRMFDCGGYSGVE